MSEKYPLATLFTLDEVIRKLSEIGEAITYTRFKNWHGFSDPTLSQALAAGYEMNALSWETGNWYSIGKRKWSLPEAAFYTPCQIALKDYFCSLSRYKEDEFFIENTSNRDSKISGRWTRPDLTMVSHKTYRWTIGQEFDVTTFEIKRPADCNVLAVFEALSHASAATRAYVVFPISEEAWHAKDPAQAARVIDECSRHGVGLFFIDQVDSQPCAIEGQQATRKALDHEKCGSFLEAVLSADGLGRIAGWKR